MAKGKCHLNASQVAILQTLAKSYDTMTRKELKEAIGTESTFDINLGPVYSKGGPGTLQSLGYVRVDVEDRDGKDVIVYSLTDAGYEVQGSVRGKRPSKAPKIPDATIIKAFKTFMPTRTYGLEHYTEEDLKTIRHLLGSEFKDFPLEEIRTQGIAHRKKGSYAPKFEYPPWYLFYRESEGFQVVSDKVINFYSQACALNLLHKQGVQVYHRVIDRINTYGGERETDLIPLCPECWKRNLKHLPPIPDEEP